MNVYRISKCNYIEDLSGTGAALYGGRWHSKGFYVLYTAASPSLALLESVVHISNIQLTGYCLLCLDIPDNSITEKKRDDLPVDWFVNPAPDALQVTGNSFIAENRYLALRLPSAIMPEESNYLINPRHPLFKKVKILYRRNIPIDERLVKGIG